MNSLAGVIALGMWNAATSQAQPAFEVASVKPAAPLVMDGGGRMVAGGRGGRGGGIRTDPQMFTARNSSLKQLVAYAYHVWNYQISGGPSWFDADPFDIEAKTEHPANDEQFRLMLQTLLADRFKLTSHRETKEVPVYALVVDKSGPKFQARKTGDDASTERRGVSFEDLASLAGILSNFSDRPVVDRTRLKGDFDLKLDMQKASEDWLRERDGDAPGDVGGPRSNAIAAAVEDQLGLKLVARKESVEVLVIDRAERPTAN
jgi:uncharacterized protein (TIGR03435 family)